MWVNIMSIYTTWSIWQLKREGYRQNLPNRNTTHKEKLVLRLENRKHSHHWLNFENSKKSKLNVKPRNQKKLKQHGEFIRPFMGLVKFTFQPL